MEVYKLKHKPTGLYYQPVRGHGGQKTNLSKRGKIYQGNSDALKGKFDTIMLTISEKQYLSNKELFDSLKVRSCGTGFYIPCPKTDFEIEKL